jgi:hypothetical protein
MIPVSRGFGQGCVEVCCVDRNGEIGAEARREGDSPAVERKGGSGSSAPRMLLASPSYAPGGWGSDRRRFSNSAVATAAPNAKPSEIDAYTTPPGVCTSLQEAQDAVQANHR